MSLTKKILLTLILCFILMIGLFADTPNETKKETRESFVEDQKNNVRRIIDIINKNDLKKALWVLTDIMCIWGDTEMDVRDATDKNPDLDFSYMKDNDGNFINSVLGDMLGAVIYNETYTVKEDYIKGCEQILDYLDKLEIRN